MIRALFSTRFCFPRARDGFLLLAARVYAIIRLTNCRLLTGSAAWEINFYITFPLGKTRIKEGRNSP